MLKKPHAKLHPRRSTPLSSSKRKKPASAPAEPDRRCFVIMPFSTITGVCTEDEWTYIFTHLIKPAVEKAGLGYSCTRSSPGIGNVLGRIVDDLDRSDVVIADLTGQNANVFYELGVRHVLRGRTILLSQDSSFIPFDLKSYAYHIYNWRTKKGKQDLRQKIAVLLKELEQHPHRPDNPVEDFIQSTAERPVFLRAPRFPSATQQSAADAYLREYSELLRSIEWGEIPIPGGASGYFGLFLETVAANKTCEDVRIFASLRPLEVKDGFSKFNRKELFTGLTRAVREKKISIEYLVFLTDRSVLARPDVRALLSEYSNFAHEVRVAYAETYTGHLVDAERTIALLTDHHWAFTHTWSIHADVTHTRQWIFEEAYKRHDETYKRLRMQSEVVFKSKKRK